MDDAETVRRLVQWLRGRIYVKPGKRGVPAWALTATILGCEKAPAEAWLVAHGIKPESKMRMTDG